MNKKNKQIESAPSRNQLDMTKNDTAESRTEFWL